MDEHEKLARVKQRVEALTGFNIHLTVFVVVMALLVVINVAASQTWWVHWPFLGWGIGLAAHAMAVFGQTPRFIRNWQTRKIKELKDKM